MRQGRWDLLRGLEPFVDERRGIDFGAGFNNHNVEKLGVTLNLRSERGRELFAALVEISDAVTENFAAGVLARLGFSYPELKAITDARYSGARTKYASDVVDLLDKYGIKTRQKDGRLKFVNISIPK